MKKSSRIYIAGHCGLVGSALQRQLELLEYKNILIIPHCDLDLENQKDVDNWFSNEQPQYVFLAAAKVGGIFANNTFPVDFICKNLSIQQNIISAASKNKVERLLFLGSSCIYPRDCPQPIKEEYLLSGPLESSNSSYAIAKIAGIEMCRAYNRQYGRKFLSVMPTNLYGPGDNYDLQNSHVLPALIRKIYDAKNNNIPVVSIWGSGKPRREFLFSDDLALACIFLMNLNDDIFNSLLQNPSHPALVNIGYGSDLTIRELAETISKIIDYKGQLFFDTSKLDGTPCKLLNSQLINNLGWTPLVNLEHGINISIQDFLKRGINLHEII